MADTKSVPNTGAARERHVRKVDDFLGDTVPCLNPECPNRCALSDSAGRPELYCDDACRNRAFKRRQKLRALLDITRAAMEGATRAEARELKRRERRLQIALAPYPPGKLPSDEPATNKLASPTAPSEAEPRDVQEEFPLIAAKHLNERHPEMMDFFGTLGNAVAYLPGAYLEEFMGEEMVSLAQDVLSGDPTKVDPQRVVPALLAFHRRRAEDILTGGSSSTEQQDGDEQAGGMGSAPSQSS